MNAKKEEEHDLYMLRVIIGGYEVRMELSSVGGHKPIKDSSEIMK